MSAAPNIVERGNNAGLTNPVITVIGAVAALHERMRWFDTGPLFGQRVLVTRSRPQASVLTKLLIEEGAEPVELPTIQIEGLTDYAKLDAALANLSEYEWTIFTSPNAVDAVFDRLAIASKDVRAFGGVRVATTGPATAASLRRRGIVPDLVPEIYTTEELAKGFSAFEMQSARVLLPRADIATDTLSKGLREQGAALDEVDCYRTTTPPGSSEKARDLLSSGKIDAVTFTSSSTVRNLVSLIDGDVSLLDRALVISIGPVTSATARNLGVRVDIEAAEHPVPGVVAAFATAQRATRAQQQGA